MPGYVRELQASMGRALHAVHRIGGIKVRYALVTSRTANPLTTSSIDIHVQPTPNVQTRELRRGRIEETLFAGGTLSAEAMPVFIVSRHALLVSGTYYDPTTDDTFRMLDSADAVYGPTYYIRQIESIGQLPHGWFLTVLAKFHDSAKG